MKKTIRELAIELNISKEAIYRKINHSMKAELADHVLKRDNKTYITEIGQSIILQSLKHEIDKVQSKQVNVEQIKVNNNVVNNEVTISLEYIRYLENQVKWLQTSYDNEVNNNRKERETLYQLNQSLIDTFSREQHLQLAYKQLRLQTLQSRHANKPANKPKGFFKKLFKKK